MVVYRFILGKGSAEGLFTEISSLCNRNLNTSLFVAPFPSCCYTADRLVIIKYGSSSRSGRLMRYSNKESGRETLLPLLWVPCEKAHQDASLESWQHIHWQPRRRKIRADRKAIARGHSHGAEGTLHTTHSQAAWQFPVPALGGLSTTVQGGINACVILFLLLIIYVVPKELAQIRHLNHIHSLKQFLYHFI